MERIFIEGITLFLRFSQNAVGCLHRPYITYRSLSSQQLHHGQIFFVYLLVVIYFWFATLTRTGGQNPYILTIQMNLLFTAAVLGFLGMILFLYYGGKLMGGTGSIKTILVLWSFTLIPTLVWFFITSFIYILLPPPRTFSFTGKIFAVAYSAFTLSVFLWKVILYYLTLRFGMKLELMRIALISIVLIPVLIGFSLFMYKIDIFRVPFI